MARYIDIDEAINTFEKLNGNESPLLNCYNADWIVSFLESQPTVDVQEVRHGKWVKSISAQDFFRCSFCCAVWNRKFEYCPHCGAKMKSGEGK